MVWFIALLPMLFFRRFIHNDLLMHMYPQQLFVNDVFHSGELPLWNPFQSCGVPLFSDPQSHIWYPLNQLIIWTVGYSIWSLQYEFVVHYLIAGIAAYVLARRFKLSKAASCLAAVSYMLSGFFIGHGEHFNLIVSFAWFPLALAGIVGWLDDKKGRNLWLIGIALILMLTGGNPATNIIAFLFMGLFLVIRGAELVISQGVKHALINLVPILAACAVAVLLSGAYLWPLFPDLAGYTDRGSGLSYQRSLESNSLPVWSLVTLAVPTVPFKNFATQFDPELSITMLNNYFGIISLSLALFAIHSRRDRKVFVLAALGLAGLIAALGGRTFLRGLLYEFLPFFKMFRHPALFRGIFILFFSLLAGFGLDQLLKNDTTAVQSFRRMILAAIYAFGLCLGFAIVATIAVYRVDLESAILLRDLFLQSLPIQIALLAAFCFWLKSQRKSWAGGVLLLVSLDLSFMANANIATVGSPLSGDKRKEVIGHVQTRARKIEDYDWFGRLDTWGLLLNTGMIYKQFETGAYNPFGPRDYAKVMDTGFHQVVAGFPRYLLVNKVSVRQSLDPSLPTFIQAAKNNSMPVIVNELPPPGIRVVTDAQYSLKDLSRRWITVLDYSINRVEVEFYSPAAALLGTTEGYHKSWQATLDNKKVPTVKVNFAFRGVYVPGPGLHTLVWEFRPRSFYQGLWLSGFGALALFLWIIFSAARPRKKPE